MQMELSLDEIRLIRYFRCLSYAQRDEAMYRVATDAVSLWLPEDVPTNGFPSLMPTPPEGFERGQYFDDVYSGDHMLYAAMEATGNPDQTLLGSSLSDTDEVLPRIIGQLKEEAERQGNFWFDATAFASELLTAWRFNVVQACEQAAAKAPTADE